MRRLGMVMRIMRALSLGLFAVFLASVAQAQVPGPPQRPVPIPPIHVIVNSGSTTLPVCGTLVCYFILDMRSSSTVTLPSSQNGQALVIKAWQNPSFGGGFTPTFAAAGGYTLKWANGAPPAAVITNGNSQMYSLVVDTQTEATPVYNEMRPGPE